MVDINGIMYEEVETESLICSGCAFYDGELCARPVDAPRCTGDSRNVIYKEIHVSPTRAAAKALMEFGKLCRVMIGGYQFSQSTPKVYCDKRTARFKEDVENYFSMKPGIEKVVVSTDRHAVKHVDYTIQIIKKDGSSIILKGKNLVDWSDIHASLSQVV